jgi:hypothetical protein
MATKSLTIIMPVNTVQQANDFLEAAGYGPDNLATPLRTVGGSYATHVATHWWATDAELTDIRQKLIDSGLSASLVDQYMNAETLDGGVIAAIHMNGRKSVDNLEEPGRLTWFDPPVMTDDTELHQGKTWRSLIDYNVYEPGVYKWVLV